MEKIALYKFILCMCVFKFSFKHDFDRKILSILEVHRN